MNSAVVTSLYFLSAACFLGLLHQYLWPQRRMTRLKTELFSSDNKVTDAYTPGFVGWKSGRDLAIWIQRSSRSYSVVKRGWISGHKHIFEIGLGRMTVLDEFPSLADAVRSLVDLRSKEHAVELRLKERQSRELAEAAENQRLVSEERRRSWEKLETSLDQLFESQQKVLWRPESTRLPAGISRDEAWIAISTSIEEMLDSLESDVVGSYLADSQILIEGFIGTSNWESDDEQLHEALIWHLLFSTLIEDWDSRQVGYSIQSRFADLERWEYLAALATLSIRVSTAHDTEYLAWLGEVAASALIRSWRLSHPSEYLSGTMPTDLEVWIEAPPGRQDKSIIIPYFLKGTVPSLHRMERFVALISP